MINYKAIKRQNPQNKGEYKWYPSIVLTNPMLLDELAEAIALNCTVTAHDIKAVLSAMQEQIIFALRQGRSVRLGDLGSFRLTISGKGEADAASVFACGIATPPPVSPRKTVRTKNRFLPKPRLTS